MPLYINAVSISFSYNLVTQNNSPLLLYRTARNVKLTEPFMLTMYIITITWKKHLLKHSYTSYTTLPDHKCTVFLLFIFCLLEMLCKSSSSERRVMMFIWCWWVKGLCFRAKVREESNLRTHVAQTPRWKQRRVCMDLLNMCPQEPVFTQRMHVFVSSISDQSFSCYNSKGFFWI